MNFTCKTNSFSLYPPPRPVRSCLYQRVYVFTTGFMFMLAIFLFFMHFTFSFPFVLILVGLLLLLLLLLLIHRNEKELLSSPRIPPPHFFIRFCYYNNVIAIYPTKMSVQYSTIYI